jgi:energy-coupling factor transport system ATP-binding protein
MEEAAKATRILVMDRGQVVRDGSPREIFRDVPGMKALRLDVPQIAALTYMLREMGVPVSLDLLSADEFLRDQTIQKIKQETNKESHEIAASPVPDTNPNTAKAFIEIKNLHYTYNPGSVFEKTAIDDISLDIAKGEIIGLIGHTGSGKSTLIQHLNAILKPTSGTITINGSDINADKKGLKKLREKVGLVFQYPEHQLFETSVYKDVAFGPAHMGLTETQINERTHAALEMVGIKPKYYDKSPFDLSGGQKRRVAIAGVLAMRPEVLILDEPAAGLDPAGREEILTHIKNMHTQMGITVILVSHSMEDAARLASRIVVLNQGKIACSGTPAEVFAEYDLLHRIGLAVPQISSLMGALHERNPRIPSGIFTVKNAAEVLYDFFAKGPAT